MICKNLPVKSISAAGHPGHDNKEKVLDYYHSITPIVQGTFRANVGLWNDILSIGIALKVSYFVYYLEDFRKYKLMI